jgi:hypothetical protein
MDEVANAEILSQCEAVFSGEGQHVLHRPPPLIIPGERLLAFVQNSRALTTTCSGEL